MAIRARNVRIGFPAPVAADVVFSQAASVCKCSRLKWNQIFAVNHMNQNLIKIFVQCFCQMNKIYNACAFIVLPCLFV